MLQAFMRDGTQIRICPKLQASQFTITGNLKGMMLTCKATSTSPNKTIDTPTYSNINALTVQLNLMTNTPEQGELARKLIVKDMDEKTIELVSIQFFENVTTKQTALGTIQKNELKRIARAL